MMYAALRTAAVAVFVSSMAYAAQAANTTPSDQTGSTTQPSKTTQSQPMQANNQDERQKFKSDLESAGFTDVTVMPESFLVRAKDKQGRPVMMVINPDSLTEIVGSNPPPSSSEAQPKTKQQ